MFVVRTREDTLREWCPTCQTNTYKDKKTGRIIQPEEFKEVGTFILCCYFIQHISSDISKAEYFLGPFWER